MKKLRNIFFILGAALCFNACERELDSEGIASGIIRYPSVAVLGEDVVTLDEGAAYQEAGAEAFLGTDDISSQVEIDGAVDTSTPGVYTLNYNVSITNEIGQQSSVSATRFVNVTSEDVSGVDLSGNYKGTGFAANPRVVAVTKLGNGWYQIEDVLSSGNGIVGVFAHTGGTELVLPEQPSPFGPQFSTSGNITAEGFTWQVFVAGAVRGPIVFVKQ